MRRSIHVFRETGNLLFFRYGFQPENDYFRFNLPVSKTKIDRRTLRDFLLPAPLDEDDFAYLHFDLFGNPT